MNFRVAKDTQVKDLAAIGFMRRNGLLLREVMNIVLSAVKPGVSTAELDAIVKKEIEDRGAIPAFLGLYGFPASLCISLNEEVVHGIPGPRLLVEGDIAGLDIGLAKDGYYVDMARTVPVGKVDPEVLRLIQVTSEALEIGKEFLRPDLRLGDLSAAIQRHVESSGFSVVRGYTGHGIGVRPHEDPQVPNFGREGTGPFWREGMTVCVEPMVNEGAAPTKVLNDQWTVVTADGSRSAHMEDTILVTRDGGESLT